MARKKAAKRRSKKVTRGKSARRAPRKTAGRKTTGRKTAAKTKSKKMGKDYEITISYGIACSASQHLKSKDKVSWSTTDGPYTVTFPLGWPFVEAPDVLPATINVPRLGNSGKFKLAPGYVKGQDFGYDIQPAPVAPVGIVPPLPVPEIIGD